MFPTVCRPANAGRQASEQFSLVRDISLIPAHSGSSLKIPIAAGRTAKLGIAKSMDAFGMFLQAAFGEFFGAICCAPARSD